MRKVRVLNSFVITLYGSLLVLLALWFLVHDIPVMHELSSNLPMTFIFRFMLFWFASFLLAVAVFLLNLNVNYIRITTVDKVYATRLCRLILSSGLVVAIALGVILYFLPLFLAE
ncbi:hypothetical protein [Pontibacter vulgaris]|uniref:hypothetical protein n=1 Tax=Pontibacter vulgaris TaxID=2905679 RepID=UPI001FA7F61F|nr:hypothetical protein [Pontibacter vulgaris]